MVDLVRSGRTPEALSREFEPTAQAIWNWVRQADRDEGRRQDGATSAERQELTRLRRENRRLRQERDILAKAAAWFARSLASARSCGQLGIERSNRRGRHHCTGTDVFDDPRRFWAGYRSVGGIDARHPDSRCDPGTTSKTR